ncbi:NlpC/P60 family protein [Streptomyces sp. NPDC021749]|uniref:C40 family peptidase n=1 Tax=Streptomyces sp. NPDC021749 TaxID=3154905 RepID=UPI00340633E9
MASHRRTSQHGQATLAGVTVLSAALATAAAALSAPPASADPAAHPAAGREAATARVDALYAQAERATEKYNGAEARTKELRAEAADLQDRTARAQERVNRMRGRLGALAAAQYRAGGMDPALKLMLSERPDSYLEKASALNRLGRHQAGRLHELRAAQRSLEQQRRETAAKLAELEASRTQVARHRKDVRRKLATAQRLLNALPRADREAWQRAARSEGRTEAVPDPAGAVPASGPASGRAAAAVAAVRAAVGSPYAWGSAGPGAFDCSGLTQWAYRRAGVSLPRTSQAQRGAGRRVPLGRIRPGDLVIYRSDASHVGMYVGNGRVVHAPYPGARVRYDPVGMMPISAVTRP